MSQWVSESVTRSPIELFWTAKKNIARGTTDPEYSRPEYKTDVIFVSIFCFLSQFSLLYIKIHKPLHFSWLFHILLLLVKHMYICAKSTKRWKHMNAPSFPRVTNMSKEGQCIGNILAKYLLHQVWTNSQWLSISI